ncbi:TetR/AcrR family transcriptional regulator [Streptomyces sp. NBC_01433]|uniref:TetR/AcrR family transcriptional regulator n=1 Tax=Streptomyces sp. NBC_01433 TaxID=2903864 RepID=UPI002B1CB18B|nr:TetR/AcrR family transcriptional regulator [Streptomyces sp. NBC_01433]
MLLQRQGYDDTGIKQIAQEAREAQATLGSVYHFFPVGKQELAVAAIHHGDQEFFEMLRAVLGHEEDPARAIAALCRTLTEGLRASDWIDGCPITTTSLGTAGRVPDVQVTAAEAFARWRGLVHDKLRASGIGESDVHDLAHTGDQHD